MTSALKLSTRKPSAEALMKKAGKTFHQASRLLPKAVRRNVVQLYAFCRVVDDLADDPSRPLPERRRSLERLAAALEQHRSADLEAAGWPFATKDVLALAACLLVRAALGDLKQQQPETPADLLAYAFGVAGTVGVMMGKVLGAAPEGFGAAVALGMAMQLSNISRDVAEDYAAGRVYLPQQWAGAEAVGLALDGTDKAATERVRKAILRTVELAADLYEIAYDGMWSLPVRLRWSILAAAMCYREIGVTVARNVERSWRERTVVSSTRKLWLIVRAGAHLLLPRFWRPKQASRWPATLGPVALERGRALGVAP